MKEESSYDKLCIFYPFDNLCLRLNVCYYNKNMKNSAVKCIKPALQTSFTFSVFKCGIPRNI